MYELAQKLVLLFLSPSLSFFPFLVFFFFLANSLSSSLLFHFLLLFPTTLEAVSFAVPDELYGQNIQAAVVLVDGQEQKTTVKELQAFVKSKVAAFKVPAHIYIVKEMPRTATGKIQRKAISELLFKPKARL